MLLKLLASSSERHPADTSDGKPPSCVAVKVPAGEGSKEGVQLVDNVKVPTTLPNFTINLIFMGCGASVLSAPAGIAASGLIAGVVILIVTLACNAAAQLFFVYCAGKAQLYNLRDLMAYATENLAPIRIGRWQILPKHVVVFFCDLASLAVFAIVGIGLLAVGCEVTRAALGATPWYTSRFVLVPLFVALAFPLCFVPMQYLSPLNFLFLLVTLYMFIYLFVEFGRAAEKDFDYPEGPGDICLFGGGIGYVATFVLNVKATGMAILPQYEQLLNRSIRRFAIANGIAFAILAIVLAGFAGIGYITYGDAVKGNILDSFGLWAKQDSTGRAEVAALVATLGIGAVCIGGLPILVAPVVQIAPRRYQKGPRKAVPIVLFLAVIAVVPMLSGNITELNKYNGVLKIFIFPGVILPVVAAKFFTSRAQRAALAFLSLFSTAMAVVSVFISVEEAREALTCAVRW